MKVANIENINNLRDALFKLTFDYLIIGKCTDKQLDTALKFYNSGCKQYVISFDCISGTNGIERGYNVTYCKELKNNYLITKETACFIDNTKEIAPQILRRGQTIIKINE